MITISIAQWQWCVCGYIEENDIAMQRRRCRSEVGGAGAAVRKLPPWKERRGGMSRSATCTIIGFVIIRFKRAGWVHHNLQSATAIMDSDKYV